MHEVWKELRFRQIRVEQISSIRQEVSMRWSRVVPGKYGMVDLMLALKDEEINSEDI